MDSLYLKEDLEQALQILKKGGIILYPTDTIWGIGCDATHAQAVQKIYDIKKRSDSKSMLVLLENPGLIASYVDEVPDVAWDLIELAERPTTIIFDGAKNLASNLIAEDGSIGIRITRESFSAALIKRFRKPIISTSANTSGNPSPSTFSEIDPCLFDAVDYVVQYRQEDISPAQPSSIIKLGRGGLVKIIRP
jgi:L-threonylcarbamoyladenylate synthase